MGVAVEMAATEPSMVLYEPSKQMLVNNAINWPVHMSVSASKGT